MMSYGNLFSDFDSVTKAMETAFNETGRIVDKALEKVTIPMNIYKDENGTQVIEIAVVGLKKENIKLTIKVENGNSYLYIKSNVPEKSEEQKQTEDKRVYSIRKIKNLADLDVRIWLPNTLDIDNASRTLENGLLTIRIPMKEESKPRELTIE